MVSESVNGRPWRVFIFGDMVENMGMRSGYAHLLMWYSLFLVSVLIVDVKLVVQYTFLFGLLYVVMVGCLSIGRFLQC